MSEPLAQALIDWYRAGHRDLPWRRSADPYRIWLSEIMLQQTQVTAVIPYYERFLSEFPTIEALAAAPRDRVLKLWEGLGYYARCRNLHRAAQVIVSEHDGRFPDRLEEVEGLPGIGRSTAGAILTFAFGQRHPILDGNVTRVLTRLFDVDEPADTGPVKRKLWERSERLVRSARDPGDLNQALMDLGATVCISRTPRCDECPISSHCLAYERGTERERPVRRPRRPLPHHHVAVGVIWDGNRLLIQQRPARGLLGGLWEFPGGKQEPGEEPAETVRREIREELGIEVEVGEHFASVDHGYTHFTVTLHAFHCRHLGGRPEARNGQPWRWVRLEDLDQFAFPRANRRLLEKLLAASS